MGHTLGELYPRGMEVELAEERAREQERADRKAARERIRSAREHELMLISGEELPFEVLKDRVTKLQERLGKVTSAIPAPITLHLKDGEDLWNVSSTDRGDSGTRFVMEKEDVEFRENETYIFDLNDDEAWIKHFERGRMDISWGKNSERELAPAEELFERLISPLEAQMGIIPAAPVEVFPAE